MRRSFTLIEIIFVLIIIAIIASIGSEILFKLYENRLIAQGSQIASEKTRLALENIAKRLSYRIPDSEVARKSSDFSDVVPLTSLAGGYDILEWIGKSYEAFVGEWNGSYYAPGYSEFIDLNNSSTTKNQVITPVSTLSYASDIIYALSYGTIELNSSTSKAAIIFKGGVHNGDPLSAFNWKYDGDTSDDEVYPVKSTNDTTLQFLSTKPDTIYEQYYLTWSAYALVPQKNPKGDYNLTLYYDYRPWLGEKYSDGKSTVLIANITRFKFKKVDRALEIGLCAHKQVTSDFNITFCGKKVVF